MSVSRSILALSDFSCRDLYCSTVDGKVRHKKTYHISDLTPQLHNPLATEPDPASIPLDGTNVLIAQGGVIKELFDDCVVWWEIDYTDCDTVSWIQQDFELEDPNTATAVPLNCAGLT